MLAIGGCIEESSEGIFKRLEESEALASESCTGTGGEALIARSRPAGKAGCDGMVARLLVATLIILRAGARGVWGSVRTGAKAEPMSDVLLRSDANSSMSKAVAEATGEQSNRGLLLERASVPLYEAIDM